MACPVRRAARTLRSIGLAATIALAVACTPGAHAPDAVDETPAVIPVFDGHLDTLIHFAEPDYSGWRSIDTYDLSTRTAGQVDLPRLREGGVAGGLFTVAALGEGDIDAKLARAVGVLAALAARHPDLQLATGDDALASVRDAGRIAVLPALEGAEQLGAGEPDALARSARAAGLRSVGLTWTSTTDLADAAGAEPRHDGLSPRGEALLRALQREGVLVDLSHAADATVTDALAIARAPLLFSHSSARALCDTPRNLPDALLRAIAANGGVVMVSFVPYLTRHDYLGWYEAGEVEWARLKAAHGDTPAAQAAMEAWETANPPPAVTVADVADHIEHVRDVAGIDHVGLGSDFDGMYSNVTGLEDASRYPALMAELRRRGWEEEALRKLGAGNFERVLAAAGVAEP